MNDRQYLNPVLAEATAFRMLHEVYSRDPAISPRTAAVMADIFRMGAAEPAVNPYERRRTRR
jgi:hypothetical protein